MKQPTDAYMRTTARRWWSRLPTDLALVVCLMVGALGVYGLGARHAAQRGAAALAAAHERELEAKKALIAACRALPDGPERWDCQTGSGRLEAAGRGTR